jgi:hypothetical protein
MSGPRTVNIAIPKRRLGKARVVGIDERRQERAAISNANRGESRPDANVPAFRVA